MTSSILSRLSALEKRFNTFSLPREETKKVRGKTREISPPGRSLETRQFPRRAYKSRIKGALRSAFSKA